MAEEEVKIHIRTEADNRGSDDTQAKIKALRAEAEKLRSDAERYGSKYGFDDHRARSARSEASSRESEANRIERPINAAQKTAQKEERDAKANALREERAFERTFAREVAEGKRTSARVDAELNKKFAAEDKAEKTAAAAAERTQRKEAAQEKRRDAAEEKAAKTQETHEETHRQRFGRLAFGRAGGIGGGGVIGGGAMFAAEEIMTDRMERQGIALRDQAARTMNERGLAITAGWRGTSGQSQSDEFATKQRMDEREANRAAFDQEQSKKKMESAWSGAKRGAVTGAIAGSFIPVIGTVVGAAIGAVVGGVVGGIHGGAEGARAKTERDAAQKRDAELLEDQKKLTRKKFVEEEGGIEMDHARHRAERTQSGRRAAFVDEQKKQWLARYRSLRDAGATDPEATQTAGLEAETRMRDRQIAAGSGLVDARSGAGDIAAAARWAGMSTPGMADLKTAFDALHTTVKDNSRKAEELQNRKDQSIK